MPLQQTSGFAGLLSRGGRRNGWMFVSADRIETAIRRVIAERKHLTVDLGGHASTAEFADCVAGVVRTLGSSVTSLR